LFNRSGQSEQLGFGEISFPEQFGWISMIDNLAGGDFTKYPLIYETSYEDCLYCLLYRHNVDKYKDQINKRQELKYR
jgi:hypothetical protein